MYRWGEFSFSGNRVTFELSLAVEVAVTAPDSLPCSVLSLEQQLCCCCHPQWGGRFFVLIEDLFSQRKCTKNLKAVCLSSAPGVLDFHCVNCNLYLLCHYFLSLQRLSLLNLNNRNHRTNLPVSENKLWILQNICVPYKSPVIA